MSKALFTEARRVAQEFNLKVIPCGDRKQPIQKGWRKLATSDPEEAEFRGASFVGVPAGPENDLIVFDLDYYKRDADGVPQPATHDVWKQLDAFETELMAAYPNQVRVHKTQSGGVHLIMLYPQGKKIARNPMPNMEVIMEGFQFIWPTDGSGYSVEDDVALDDLAEPDERFLKVRFRAEGMSTGSGLMTPEKADEVMRTDGEIGTRHDALLRITQDLVGELDDGHLRSMTDAQIAELIQRHLQNAYGNHLSAERAEQLFEVRSERDGTLSGGELGNALKGPLKNRRALLGDRFAEMAAKKAGVMASAKKSAADLYAEKVSGARSLMEIAAEKKAEAEEDDLPPLVKERGDVSEELTPWLIQGFVRVGKEVSITGMSNVGKTTLSASLIAGMLAGRTDLFGLGHVERPLNVMWLNVEETAGDMFAHIAAAQHQHGLPETGKIVVLGSDVLSDPNEPHGADIVYEAPDPATGRLMLQPNTRLIKRLEKDMIKHKIDIMMMDPITELNGGNEDKRYDARMLNRVFKQMALKTGASCIYWAHTGKPPEGKRPDWYKDDQFAQRGSSQNTGNTEGTATLFPHLTTNGNAAKAWEAWKTGKEEGGHNLIKLNMVRIKKHRHLLQQVYEIIPSDHNEDIPVAIPVDADRAAAMVDAGQQSGERQAMIATSKALVEVLGVGRWGRAHVIKQMAGRNVLPAKDVRASRNEEWLRQWKHGYKVVCDDGDYFIKSIYDSALHGFSFDISRLVK